MWFHRPDQRACFTGSESLQTSFKNNQPKTVDQTLLQDNRATILWAALLVECMPDGPHTAR
jgi:hypothetical protein